MKFYREVREYGESLGLQYLGMEDRGNHDAIVFKNSDGRIYRQLFSKGAGEVDFRMRNLMKTSLKRFARCEYHGLKVSGGHPPAINREASGERGTLPSR